MTTDLATAARIYFDASENASAVGKTADEFQHACNYAFHCRAELLKALEAYERE